MYLNTDETEGLPTSGKEKENTKLKSLNSIVKKRQSEMRAVIVKTLLTCETTETSRNPHKEVRDVFSMMPQQEQSIEFKILYLMPLRTLANYTIYSPQMQLFLCAEGKTNSSNFLLIIH